MVLVLMMTEVRSVCWHLLVLAVAGRRSPYELQRQDCQEHKEDAAAHRSIVSKQMERVADEWVLRARHMEFCGKTVAARISKANKPYYPSGKHSA